MKRFLTLLLACVIITLCVSCTDKPSSEQAGSPQGEAPQKEAPQTNSTGIVYMITDYYNEDGGFSALGKALDEENSEKVLKVKAGDVLIIDGKRYTVAAESITLSFYTQSSHAEVIQWWTDFLEGWKRDGRVTVAN